MPSVFIAWLSVFEKEDSSNQILSFSSRTADYDFPFSSLFHIKITNLNFYHTGDTSAVLRSRLFAFPETGLKTKTKRVLLES